jgi:catechol 2,3-dioxygenase-like lactoylglutathione lyase family enzyme
MKGTPFSGVNELVLEVLDLERSLRFYTEALGLPIVEPRERPDRAWLLIGEQTRLGLWTPQVGLAQGRGGVHVHYAIRTAEGDFDAVVERVREWGSDVELISFEEDNRGRAAYIHDPDGNVVELWTWDVARYLD